MYLIYHTYQAINPAKTGFNLPRHVFFHVIFFLGGRWLTQIIWIKIWDQHQRWKTPQKLKAQGYPLPCSKTRKHTSLPKNTSRACSWSDVFFVSVRFHVNINEMVWDLCCTTWCYASYAMKTKTQSSQKVNVLSIVAQQKPNKQS